MITASCEQAVSQLLTRAAGDDSAEQVLYDAVRDALEAAGSRSGCLARISREGLLVLAGVGGEEGRWQEGVVLGLRDDAVIEQAMRFGHAQSEDGLGSRAAVRVSLLGRPWGVLYLEAEPGEILDHAAARSYVSAAGPTLIALATTIPLRRAEALKEALASPSSALMAIVGIRRASRTTPGSGIGDLARYIRLSVEPVAQVLRIDSKRVALVNRGPLSGSGVCRLELLLEQITTESRALGAPVDVYAGVGHRVESETPQQWIERVSGALRRASRLSPGTVLEDPDPSLSEASAASDRMQGLRALTRALDLKDPTTSRHLERVADLAGAIAQEMGWNSDRAEMIHQAALVHDIGKIGVPDAILLKEGGLTPAERAVISQHPELSALVASELLSVEQVSWIRSHHERWDGAGYPDQLREDEIPEGAAIICLADAYDAMVSNRYYRPALSVDHARRECIKGSGTQFSPAVVEAFLRIQEALVG